jgi:hypothetical protein
VSCVFRAPLHQGHAECAQPSLTFLNYQEVTGDIRGTAVIGLVFDSLLPRQSTSEFDLLVIDEASTAFMHSSTTAMRNTSTVLLLTA